MDAFAQQVLSTISIVDANPYTESASINAINPDVAATATGLSERDRADRCQSGESDLGIADRSGRDGCACGRGARRVQHTIKHCCYELTVIVVDGIEPTLLWGGLYAVRTVVWRTQLSDARVNFFCNPVCAGERIVVGKIAVG